MNITINTGNKTTIIAGFESFDKNSEIFQEKIPTNPLYTEQFQKIKDILSHHIDAISAIGIAHAGGVDGKGNIIISSSYTPDYARHNIAEDLQKEFGEIPVYIENDSVCATIAEVYFGKVQDANTVGLMYLSAGIGGSYLKKIGTSYSIFEAEIGHQIIDLNGMACVCGQRGCLEAYVGAESIKRRFLMEQKDITDERIWADIVDCMAIGVTNLYTMFYPEVLVISGETLDEVPYIREHLVEKTRERIEWLPDKDIPILLSDFGEKGPTYGALALIKIKEGGNTIKVIY